MTTVAAGLLGYLFGSIPFAWLLAHERGIDIHAVGSGNVGATNVRRSMGWRAGLLTAALDAAKGAMPVLLVRWAGADVPAQAMAGLAAVVGHVAPVWLRGRGGKGVATTLGAALVWAPVAASAGLLVFALVVGLTRVVSVASLAAAVTVGPLAFVIGAPRPLAAALCAAGGVIIVRHRSNCARLWTGVERHLD